LFLVFFPCISILQPKLVHLYRTSSLLPSPLPTVASACLRLLYSVLYSKHYQPHSSFWFSSLSLSCV
jgi:hypothetical protein